MWWQKVRARNVSVLVNACSRFPAGWTSQASSAMPEFVSRWCFVDHKFPFAWWRTVFCEQITPHLPGLICFLQCLKISLSERPYSYLYSDFWFDCGLTCKFLAPLWFEQFLVHKWCLYLPSKMFLCIFLNTGFPDRPSSSTESIFWCRKAHCWLPGDSFYSFLVYLFRLSVQINFFLVCVRATPLEIVTVVGRFSFMLAWRRKAQWW